MCPTCKALMDAAQIAISAHLEAVADLQRRVKEGASDDLPQYQDVVGNASTIRENAVAAFRRHRAGHGSRNEAERQSAGGFAASAP